MNIKVDYKRFLKEFRSHGLGDRFSEEGFWELFQMLDEDYDSNLQLDVIAICEEFHEVDELHEDYKLYEIACQFDGGIIAWNI